jgi:hypothetical protein
VKDLSVNTANCSHKELVGIAQQSGFEVFEGNKHTKVKTSNGKFVTMIPRHDSLNKHTAKGIVEDMNTHGATIRIV